MTTSKLILVATIMLLSCRIAKSDFDWLIGSWERTNGQSGMQTIEHWEKVDNKTYKAHSIVLKQKDTLYQEYCTIQKEGNHYYYIADIPQNPNPIKFKIVGFSPEGFKAVNPEHDFPKEISYIISGNTIIASISGGDKQIEYNFEKQQ
mgnify:CR=1 FL=1